MLLDMLFAQAPPSQPTSSSSPSSSPPGSDAPMTGGPAEAPLAEVPPMPSLPADGDKDVVRIGIRTSNGERKKAVLGKGQPLEVVIE